MTSLISATPADFRVQKLLGTASNAAAFQVQFHTTINSPTQGGTTSSSSLSSLSPSSSSSSSSPPPSSSPSKSMCLYSSTAMVMKVLLNWENTPQQMRLRQKYMAECVILSLLPIHRNLIHPLGSLALPCLPAAFVETLPREKKNFLEELCHTKSLAILMPHCGISLSSFLSSFSTQSKKIVEVAHDLLLQGLKAIHHIESHSIVHRDIKDDNILVVQESGKLTLIDFGEAQNCPYADLQVDVSPTTTSWGNTSTIPPELSMFLKRETSGVFSYSKCDSFALALTFWDALAKIPQSLLADFPLQVFSSAQTGSGPVLIGLMNPDKSARLATSKAISMLEGSVTPQVPLSTVTTFQVDTLIGTGSRSIVVNRDMVMKVLFNWEDTSTPKYLAECEILSLVPKHPNVIHPLGEMVVPCLPTEFVEKIPQKICRELCQKNSFVMLMPNCGITLPLFFSSLVDQGIKKQKFADVTESLFVQGLKAIHHIASHFVVHRDIKGANILVDPESGKLTLIDFGEARHCPKMILELNSRTQAWGNPGMMPPELSAFLKRIAGGAGGVFSYSKCDSFSLALTFWDSLLPESHKFIGTPLNHDMTVAEDDLTRHVRVLKEVMLGMMHPDKDTRLSASDAIHSITADRVRQESEELRNQNSSLQKKLTEVETNLSNFKIIRQQELDALNQKINMDAAKYEAVIQSLNQQLETARCSLLSQPENQTWQEEKQRMEEFAAVQNSKISELGSSLVSKEEEFTLATMRCKQLENLAQDAQTKLNETIARAETAEGNFAEIRDLMNMVEEEKKEVEEERNQLLERTQELEAAKAQMTAELHSLSYKLLQAGGFNSLPMSSAPTTPTPAHLPQSTTVFPGAMPLTISQPPPTNRTFTSNNIAHNNNTTPAATTPKPTLNLHPQFTTPPQQHPDIQRQHPPPPSPTPSSANVPRTQQRDYPVLKATLPQQKPAATTLSTTAEPLPPPSNDADDDGSAALAEFLSS
ncbi:hypothetical protein Pelo_4277 [Pelomyxa schiedti]|nr:hypothetical protein Pelo_4277 [Pelomyxa schiedti]